MRQMREYCTGPSRRKTAGHVLRPANGPAGGKYVPAIEKIEGGYVVKIGSIAHPMGNDHWIEWIELASEDNMFVQRQMLTPAGEPKAEFKTDAAKVVARAYCNLHGLWKS